MISFQKARSDGWRYSLTHRTRKQEGIWVVQRWNGEEWIHVGQGLTYGDARALAARS
jgi:hypothetical protein